MDFRTFVGPLGVKYGKIRLGFSCHWGSKERPKNGPLRARHDVLTGKMNEVAFDVTPDCWIVFRVETKKKNNDVNGTNAVL